MHKMNVFITVDTELYPQMPRWQERKLEDDIQRDIYGVTPQGEFGLRYQCELFKKHGLKAVFFVESLFGSVVGLDPLRLMADLIQSNGHEVQLHVHAEWLKHVPRSIWAGGAGYNISELTQEDQTKLIDLCLHNLKESGAKKINAFRAGNYGANFNTLNALEKNGIAFDTSYNYCYLNKGCGLRFDAPKLQPFKIKKIYEFPISFFSDWQGHYRHAQITAASYAELTTAMMKAWQQGWGSFVIVFHSSELLMDKSRRLNYPRPDRILIHRFERFCDFLAGNRDKFNTMGFIDIEKDMIPDKFDARIINSSIFNTAGRMVEQGLRQVLDKVSIAIERKHI